MKRIKNTAHYIKIQKTKSRKILRRQRRIRRRKKALNRMQYNKKWVKKKKRGVTVSLPSTCSLEENYNEYIDSVRELLKVIRNQDFIKRIVFEKIKELHPSAALILAATISHYTKLTNRRMHPLISRWEPKIASLLTQMGFLELFGYDPEQYTDGVDSDLTFLRFQAGRLVEGERAKDLRQRIESRFQTKLTQEQRTSLYDGLVEAIDNVTQHAYYESHPEGCDKWWISAAHNSFTNILTIMVLDLGHTIPETLIKTPKEKLISTIPMLKDRSDGNMIKAALEHGRTRTNELGRGEGMAQFFDFLKEMPAKGSSLTIYSRHGKITANRSGVLEHSALSEPFPGTLVQWEVKLV